MVEHYEKMYANLHFHSVHSDGVDTPEDLARIAKEEGYGALSLTDHDTVTGQKDMQRACEKYGLEFLVGCEFYAKSDVSFHIVGLDFDPEHPRMAEYQEYARKRCVYRTKGLFDMGLERGTLSGITWEEIEEDHPGITFLCVDHVFRTMKKKGLLTDADYNEFFMANFTHKIPFKNIYPVWSVKDIFDLIHDAGGIVIFAHPGYQDRFPYFNEFLEMGMDGVEIMHKSNFKPEADITRELYELAAKHELYISGGSDHAGLMGGQYAYFEGKIEDCPYYVPPLKCGCRKQDFENIKNRIYG